MARWFVPPSASLREQGRIVSQHHGLSSSGKQALPKKDVNETMWPPNTAVTCSSPAPPPHMFSLRCPNAGSRAARPPFVLGREAQPGWSTGGRYRGAWRSQSASAAATGTRPPRGARPESSPLPQVHRRYRKLAPSRRAPPSSGAAVSFQIWGCCKRRLAAAAQPRSGPAAASKIRFAYTAPGGPLEHAGGALGLVTLHGSDR